MVDNSSDSFEDDLVIRRTLLSVRRAAPVLALIVALAGVAAYLDSSNDEAVFRSQGALELTDELASGINVRSSRSDARVEIEAQLLRLTSEASRLSVDQVLGPDASQLVSLNATNTDSTPVLVVDAVALSPEVAEQAVDAALDTFIATRTVDVAAQVERELGPLQSQREGQLLLIDGLAAELGGIRASGDQDQISILESRTAAALRRLEDYDVAIQEREFVIQTATGRVRVINRATDAVQLQSGSVARSFQVGTVALIVSLLMVVTYSRVRGRFILLDEVRAIAGPDVPILATVPRFRQKLRKGREALVVGRRNTRREAEAFRYMRTAIEVATDGMTPVVIAFTSSGPNEGKTVTSSNFALATARAERSVALLDGDLLNPSTGKLFGINGSNAFVGILTGRVDPTTEQWHRVVTAGEPLDVLVSGRQPAQVDRQELPTHAVEATFAKLAQMWDTVVVDCPPVLAVSDAMVLARAADVAILMVRMGHTTKRDLDKALTQLEQNQVNIAGIVVTHSTDKDESYYGYGYAYGAESG